MTLDNTHCGNLMGSGAFIYCNVPASDVIFVNALFSNKISFKNVIDSILEKGAVFSLLGY